MLHIINKSPLENSALNSCLEVATAGATILLIEDAVYAATTGHPASRQLEVASSRFKFFALQADLDARGMGDRLQPSVGSVDYGGFVDLVTGNRNCQSWL